MIVTSNILAKIVKKKCILSIFQGLTQDCNGSTTHLSLSLHLVVGSAGIVCATEATHLVQHDRLVFTVACMHVHYNNIMTKWYIRGVQL